MHRRLEDRPNRFLQLILLWQKLLLRMEEREKRKQRAKHWLGDSAAALLQPGGQRILRKRILNTWQTVRRHDRRELRKKTRDDIHLLEENLLEERRQHHLREDRVVTTHIRQRAHKMHRLEVVAT